MFINNSFRNKFITIEKIDDMLISLRQQNKTIVFTNGCFDIIHLGHLDYLENAKRLGDFLIVGVNSDLSVKINKGKDRPINNEVQRAVLLAALEFVDAVVVFNEKTPLNLIQKIQPNILVKGGDYEPNSIVGSEFVKQYGGAVTILPFLEGYSTTSIIDRIRKL